MSNPLELVDEVVISWKEIKHKKFLHFYFQGNFTDKEAEPAIERWKEEFKSVQNGNKVDLVWNCIDMRKYSAGAAKLWKGAMSAMNEKIDTIWLVSSNTFIRMGAKTVTFLLPINLKVVSTEYEIQ